MNDRAVRGDGAVGGTGQIASEPRLRGTQVWRVGMLAAVLALLLDQASKIWLLQVFGLGARQPVHLAPVLDLVLAWNRGISYSLFWAEGETGRWLLTAGTLAATALLAFWLARARSRITGLALGLLIGGAIGNVVDRVIYGAVMDFVFFHIGTFRWYIFNGADCAIVLGAILLVAELLRPSTLIEANNSP